MGTITEIQTQLDQLEDYAVSLEIEILATQKQIQSETDETHITFLEDHLCVLKFEFHKANTEICILRQKIKILENEKKFYHQL